MARSRADLAEEFAEFHSANPHIYEALVRLARRALRDDPYRRRLSARMLWEVVRYDTWSNTSSRSAWKLSNDLVPLYARLMMQQEIDLRGVFQTHSSSRSLPLPLRSPSPDGLAAAPAE